jgi:hypothetical protein
MALCPSRSGFVPAFPPIALSSRRKKRGRLCILSGRRVLDTAFGQYPDAPFLGFPHGGKLKAVAQIDDIGHGQTTITVVVKQPEVEHVVRVRNFEGWLEPAGRTPVEMSLKTRLRQLLGK